MITFNPLVPLMVHWDDKLLSDFSKVLGMILLNCIVILILIPGSKLYHDTDTF